MLLRMLVGLQKQDIYPVDGYRMKVQPIFVRYGQEYCQLQECTNFRNVVDVEIAVARWFLPFRIVELSLTPEIKRGILEFLHHYHAKGNQSFNCYSFVCLVYGIDWRDGQARYWRFWDVMPYRWRRVVGDVVLLSNKEQTHFGHAAIYIGLGLYLSVCGAGGDLEIATLKDMKKGYHVDRVILISPYTSR